MTSSIAGTSPDRLLDLRGAGGRARVGDRVAELARGYAARMNATRFATDLRERTLDRHRFVVFAATMYPVVVGFNRALIRAIAKVDHVRNAAFVRVLAEQIQEEQAHNELWRAMLGLFGVDHAALYEDLESYLAGFTQDKMSDLARDVLAAARTGDGCADAWGRFPGAVLPDPVLALYHLLWSTATSPDVSHWEHFASQAGMEMVIWDVVSTSFLPGIAGNPALDIGPESTAWLREHGLAPGAKPAAAGRTDEEKHLELSRVALNRSDAANAAAEAVIARAEDAMRLFHASLACQDAAAKRFPIDRYTIA